MDHEHLVLGECWYTIRYKRPLFVVRILEWGLRTRDIYNMLIFSKEMSCSYSAEHAFICHFHRKYFACTVEDQPVDADCP